MLLHKKPANGRPLSQLIMLNSQSYYFFSPNWLRNL